MVLVVKRRRREREKVVKRRRREREKVVKRRRREKERERERERQTDRQTDRQRQREIVRAPVVYVGVCVCGMDWCMYMCVCACVRARACVRQWKESAKQKGGTASDTYSPFQKNWSLTTTTCRLIRMQTVARPEYGVRVLIKEEDDDVWRQNDRPVWVLGVVPSRCRLNTAVYCPSKYFFLVTEHFQASGCYFSGWGSPVGSFLISEISTFTIDDDEEARKGRTTEPWRSPPSRQRRSTSVNVHPKKHVCFDKKKVLEFSFCQHISDFLLSSSLHRTSAVAEQSHRRLAFARRRWDWYMYDTHLQQTLACG